MQADEQEAARRTAARAADRPAADLANKPAGEAPFDEDDWMAEEIPFNADQRTRERPETIVCGTPEIPYDPRTQVVIAPPPVTSPHQDPALAENLIRLVRLERGAARRMCTAAAGLVQGCRSLWDDVRPCCFVLGT